MTAISLNLYLSKVSNVWNAGEGDLLAQLLSFRDSHIANPRLQVPDPEAAVERVLDPPLDEMVAAHIRGCWAWSEGDMMEAYKCQSMVVSSFAKLLGNLLYPFIQSLYLMLYMLFLISKRFPIGETRSYLSLKARIARTVKLVSNIQL